MTMTEAGLNIPPCACCGLDATASEMLYIARALMLEFPDIVWSSGTRCEKHNSRSGGSKASGHLPLWGPGNNCSYALDGTINVWNRKRIRKILFRAIEHGACGVGYYPKQQSFHIDIKPRLQLWKPGPTGRLRYFFT